MENVITLGKLIGLLLLYCLPLLSILFLKTRRNNLARPVMGTIFLVITIRSLGRKMTGSYNAVNSRSHKTLYIVLN